MAKNEKAVASVLAFEKKLVPSDGYFYVTSWDRRNEQTPLKLIPKSVRGTISNRLKPAVAGDPMKLNAEVEKANLQTVDACALGEHQDTLKVGFTLKVAGQAAVIVSGDRVNSQCKAALARATRGDQVTISDIKTKLVGSDIMLSRTAPVIYEIQ